jgi:hypothetical protein
LGDTLAGVQTQFEQRKADSPAAHSSEIFGAEAELNYAVRRIAETNNLNWDEKRIDAIALYLTKNLHFYTQPQDPRPVKPLTISLGDK